MSTVKISAPTPFQAGCLHRLARRKLPPVAELPDQWGYSVLEAQEFEGGYSITKLTQDSIRGGPAAVAAEREILRRLNEGIAFNTQVYS